jgi:hypothetical protein
MDLSKLSSNDKLAMYGSIVVVVAGIVSAWGGAVWISVLAAIGMLAVLFLPQLAPNVTLPGSKGSLMVVLGGAAAAFALLGGLVLLGYIGLFLGALNTILYLVTLVGALVMGWAGWQAFQAEGGKLDLKMPTTASGGATTTPPPAGTPAAPEAPAVQAPAPEAPPAGNETVAAPESTDESGSERPSA